MSSMSKSLTTFTSTTVSDGYRMRLPGSFNISLDFTTGVFVGTAILQRSFDDGVTWASVTDAQGNVASWTANMNSAWFDPEDGVQYRWNVTRSSGTLYARISQ